MSSIALWEMPPVEELKTIARHVPVAMVFSSSTGGISHNAIEDTPPEHLAAAIRAYGELANIGLLR